VVYLLKTGTPWRDLSERFGKWKSIFNRFSSWLYDKDLYRIRYRGECFFHSLKRCRRIATRYEKTGRNYLALVHLACALILMA
jgi:transposase